MHTIKVKPPNGKFFDVGDDLASRFDNVSYNQETGTFDVPVSNEYDRDDVIKVFKENLPKGCTVE